MEPGPPGAFATAAGARGFELCPEPFPGQRRGRGAQPGQPGAPDRDSGMIALGARSPPPHPHFQPLASSGAPEPSSTGVSGGRELLLPTHTQFEAKGRVPHPPSSAADQTRTETRLPLCLEERDSCQPPALISAPLGTSTCARSCHGFCPPSPLHPASFASATREDQAFCGTAGTYTKNIYPPLPWECLPLARPHPQKPAREATGNEKEKRVFSRRVLDSFSHFARKYVVAAARPSISSGAPAPGSPVRSAPALARV